MLQQAARDFMAREAPREAVVAQQKSETGFRPEVWAMAAELGWLGMLIPPGDGGRGGGAGGGGRGAEKRGGGLRGGGLGDGGGAGLAGHAHPAGVRRQRRRA